MSETSNGERKPVISHLALTFNHDTFHLEVKGEAPTYEVFMSMIEQARRYFEQELRAAGVLQVQKQLVEQRRNLAIADRVAGRG